MLTKLRIKNFKCFQDTGDLNIKPLTFLVGPNSSGKSSILQMLLILKQTVENIDIKNPLLVNGKRVEMGSYPEFIYMGEDNRELVVNLEFTEPHVKEGNKPRIIKGEICFYYENHLPQIKVKEYEFFMYFGESKLEHEKLEYEKGKGYSIRGFVDKGGEILPLNFDNVEPRKFYGFESLSKPYQTLVDTKLILPSAIEYKYLGYKDTIEIEFNNIRYISHLREPTKRLYSRPEYKPQEVGLKGEQALDILWHCQYIEKGIGKEIFETAKKWFKELEFAQDFKIEKVDRGSYYKFIVIDQKTGFETSLANIGFGASQTIPIIVGSFFALPESLIMVEQPELHMHPKAQATLGDLFIEASQKRNTSFIIETHSEHILARVRRRIAEGKTIEGKTIEGKTIKKEDVAIYYFNPTSEGTKIQEVTLDDLGQFENFPDGFFEEDYEEAYQHLKAIEASYSKQGK